MRLVESQDTHTHKRVIENCAWLFYLCFISSSLKKYMKIVTKPFHIYYLIKFTQRPFKIRTGLFFNLIYIFPYFHINEVRKIILIS